MSNSNNGLATSTSTLRPRTKRLISGLSEGDEAGPHAFDDPPRRITSPDPSPFDGRSASPIPQAHPHRSGSGLGRSDAAQRFAGNSWGRRAQVGATQRKPGDNNLLSPTSLSGLWGSSWSTLQGLASDFLGNDVTAASSGNVKASQKRPLHRQRLSTTTGPSEWGPTAPTSAPANSGIGSGTREERENALRAQKRKDMLMRQDSSYADALGKFKRRLSDDHESMSAPPSEGDHDRAALVYLHHVRKDDTLAGITIKFNCSANVLRKANRMWPNDTVQSRQTLVLPVDACGVKGKPVPEPQAMDLLSGVETTDDMQAEEVTTPKPPAIPNGEQFSSNRDRSTSLSTTTATTTTSRRGSSGESGEPPWHHDSWVLFPGATKPTEIARLSRRALGYFPPARRKSLTGSTPSTSLDLTRTISSNRPRRTSNAGSGYHPNYLAGPGGVGTMNRNVHHPGPAQDGLNKFFAKHLPDVAPPKNQTDLLQPDIPEAESGFATPSLLSQNSIGGGGLNVNLENFGGAIEGWMRRVLTPTPTGKTPRSSVGAPGRGRGGVGDLIEMTDEFEIGADEDIEDDGRGRRQVEAYGGKARSVGGKSGKND